jgi:NAD-dependent dihydropyrimidine dehydrogenase PreA subunit
MFKVAVNPDICTGDEECVEVCPVNVFQLQNGRAFPYQADECLGCGSCIEVCEPAAITVEEV